MPKAAYHLFSPEALGSCVVFSSPHSGRDYPASFVRRSQLDERTIRSSEDAFVDLLFASAPEFGAPLLTAGAPRAYLDLNRSVDELDPALIEGVRRQGYNPRVASGLGVIPRVVANGRCIYSGRLSMIEARRRIDSYWHPYHSALQELLNAAHSRYGQAVLIDCHSMPHEAMDGTSLQNGKRPEIVLGDRFGAAASGPVVDQVEAAFVAAGFTVTRNAPFAGAYVAQAYGRPSRNQHTVQIEIDRSLYMDERSVRPSENFDAFMTQLRSVIVDIAKIGLEELPLAAE